jgi:hypothetical protein
VTTAELYGVPDPGRPAVRRRQEPVVSEGIAEQLRFMRRQKTHVSPCGCVSVYVVINHPAGRVLHVLQRLVCEAHLIARRGGVARVAS